MFPYVMYIQNITLLFVKAAYKHFITRTVHTVQYVHLYMYIVHCTCTLYMYCTCTIVHVHRINSILDLLVYCIMCSICILYIYTYLYGNRGAEILKVNFYFPPSAPNLCFYAVHRQAVYIYIYVHRPIPYLQLSV